METKMENIFEETLGKIYDAVISKIRYETNPKSKSMAPFQQWTKDAQRAAQRYTSPKGVVYLRASNGGPVRKIVLSNDR